MFVSHPPYLRVKARDLRARQALTLDEIAERLALPRTTVWFWISDLPLPRSRATPAQRLGNAAMRGRWKRERDDAYEDGRATFSVLSRDASFRDFVCLYLAEGYKRSRNTVSLANSDAAVIRLSARWIRRTTRNKVTFHLQYHADQDLRELTHFWAAQTGVEPAEIRLQRKSNSGQLAGRTWRSRHGVLTVCSNDTLLRARVQAWMDCLRESWADARPAQGDDDPASGP